MTRGIVISFYSFKGGVGRSFALANIGVSLAKWGYRVLVIDWDLEAPGLPHYFKQWHEAETQGVLEMVEEFANGKAQNWRNYFNNLKIPQCADRLSFMPAGIQDNSYVERVQNIDWNLLYSELDLGSYLEQIRTEWKAEYDFILIDSRTGITDIGGICTIQLPDIIVFVFTANDQSLSGAINVVRLAIKARDRLPYDRARLLSCPLVSRFDARDEYELSVKWQKRFSQTLEPLFDNWAHKRLSAADIIDKITIPYFSYWSFGEGLPVVSERSSNPEFISYYLENISALIAHRLDGTELLVESRDAYVDAAKRYGMRGGGFSYDVYISYSIKDKQMAELIKSSLQETGTTVFWPDIDVSKEYSLTNVMGLNESASLVVMIGRELSPTQLKEVNQFLRHAIHDESSRTVIPVLLTEDAKVTDLPSVLRHTRSVSLIGTTPQAASVAILGILRGTASIVDTNILREEDLKPTKGATLVLPGVDELEDELNLRKRAVIAAENSTIRSLDTEYDANQKHIVNFIRNKLASAKTEILQEFKILEKRQYEIDNELGSYSPRQRFTEIVEGSVERILKEHETELRKTQLDEQISFRGYRAYRIRHNIDRPARYPNWRIMHWAIITILVLTESLANSQFLAKVQPFGLLGAFILASFISATNIGLGLVTGMYVLPWRNQRHLINKSTILPTTIAITIAGFLGLFNLACAHFRVLLEDTSEQAVKLTIDRLFSTPLNIINFDAWILLIIGLIFAAITHIVAYKSDDPLREYGQLSRRYDHTRDENAALMKRIRARALSEFDEKRKELLFKAQIANSMLVEYKNHIERSKAIIAEFREWENRLEEVLNTLLMRYREYYTTVNILNPEPTYFNDQYTFQEQVKYREEEVRILYAEERLAQLQKIVQGIENTRDEGLAQERNVISKVEEMVDKFIEDIRGVASEEIDDADGIKMKNS